MTKSDLINAIAETSGEEKNVVEKVLGTFETIVIENLKQGKEVTLTGFGTFLSKYRSARKGVNPQKPSEMIDVPAVNVPKFRAGKTLKDALKGGGHSAAAAPVESESSPTAETSATAPESHDMHNPAK